MGELFISYSREDAAAAGQLASALRNAGYEVWWDRRLTGGSEYSREIEDALERSAKVLVLWSAHAAHSPWVRDEASAARDAGKLVPIAIDGTAPPLGFRQFHTLHLTEWLQAPARPLPAALLEAVGADRASADAANAAAEEVRQRIGFCRTPDGVTLAYGRLGKGPPLVKAANWLNHLEHELETPLWSHWIEELSRNHTLFRYDARGNGMSDWNVPALTFDLLVEDLVTAVDAAGLDRFDLVGISQGCTVAIAFAVRQPERVRKLVLINGFAAGWRYAEDPEFVETWQAMITLARTGWGKNSPAFRQVFTSQFFPDATREQAKWWNELQRKAATAENAVKFLELFGRINVSSLLRQVRVPTLVMHCRDDQFVPFEAGRLMASRISGAEFVPLESNNHLPLRTDPAWPKLTRELRRFLA
jgi:pimeloyl-ACP methyl ester carboxylesterase